MIEADKITHKFNYRIIKRAFDIFFSTILIFILSPLFFAIAMLVLLLNGYPFLYKWDVHGFKGKRFISYKFRTMVTNADSLKKGLQDFNEMSSVVFKIKDDPRITPFGKILRKYSLDELPQLFAILKGDMSFIGPRPEICEYTDLYNDEDKIALSVLPGLSDLASLKYIKLYDHVGYEDPHRKYLEKVFKDKNRLRVEYAKRQSFVLDFIILWKTIFSVINSTIL